MRIIFENRALLFLVMVHRNLLMNAPITVKVVERAEYIFGPIIAAPKGKTIRHNPVSEFFLPYAPHRYNTHLVVETSLTYKGSHLPELAGGGYWDQQGQAKNEPVNYETYGSRNAEFLVNYVPPPTGKSLFVQKVLEIQK